jgi:hypothetical protein
MATDLDVAAYPWPAIWRRGTYSYRVRAHVAEDAYARASDALAASEARVAALEGALREADDALVAVVNHRVPDPSHPLGVSHPMDGPIIVQVDRAISRSREALAAAPTPEGGRDE